MQVMCEQHQSIIPKPRCRETTVLFLLPERQTPRCKAMEQAGKRYDVKNQRVT